MTDNKLKIFIPKFSYVEKKLIEIFELNAGNQLKISDLAIPFFEIVNQLELSDWVLIPAFITSLTDENGLAFIRSTQETASEHNKPFGVFSNSDLIVDPRVENVFIFSPGAYRSIPNIIDLPATLPNDPLQKWYDGKWDPIVNIHDPSVGFCGQATINPFKAIKDLIKIASLGIKQKSGKVKFMRLPVFLPAWERGRLLHHLAKSKKIKTNFLLRTQYKGGASSTDEKDAVEKEFFNNIYTNLFTICMRGFGNYSVRFFQTLSLGRIPVLIDTDSSVSFSEFIGNKEFFIRVPYHDRRNTDEYLIKFLQGKSQSDLIKYQKGCREIWENYYKKEGLIKYVAEEMKSISVKTAKVSLPLS